MLGIDGLCFQNLKLNIQVDMFWVRLPLDSWQAVHKLYIEAASCKHSSIRSLLFIICLIVLRTRHLVSAVMSPNFLLRSAL